MANIEVSIKIGSLGIAVESAAKPLACLAKPLKTLGGVLNPVSFSRQFPKSQNINNRIALDMLRDSQKEDRTETLETLHYVRAG